MIRHRMREAVNAGITDPLHPSIKALHAGTSLSDEMNRTDRRIVEDGSTHYLLWSRKKGFR